MKEGDMLRDGDSIEPGYTWVQSFCPLWPPLLFSFLMNLFTYFGFPKMGLRQQAVFSKYQPLKPELPDSLSPNSLLSVINLYTPSVHLLIVCFRRLDYQTFRGWKGKFPLLLHHSSAHSYHLGNLKVKEFFHIAALENSLAILRSGHMP